MPSIAGGMASLHTASILFAGGVIGLVGSLLLLRSCVLDRSQDRAATVPAVWIGAPLVQAAATFGNAFRGQLPEVFVFSALNALQVLAVSLLWLGVRRMAGRATPAWMAAMPPTLWLAACLVPGFLASLPMRVTVIGSLICGLLAWTVMDLLVVHRSHRLRSARDLAAIVGLVAVSLVVLFLTALLIPRQPGGVWAVVTPTTAIVVALYGTMLPLLILGIWREQERAEEGARRAQALEAGRAEVQRLHDGLPVIIFLRAVQPDGSSRLIYRGGDLEGVTGWPAERLRGETSLQSLSGPENPSLEEHLRAALRDGSAVTVWRLRQPTGLPRTMRTYSHALQRFPDGTTEIVGYILDITAERAVEARAMAAARLASLGEMGSGLAHEIKQPLQALSLAAETAALAARRGDLDVVTRNLDCVAEEAQRAASIVEHLRRFARGMPAGAQPSPLSLAEPVEGALRLAACVLRNIGAEVEVSLGTPPVMAVGDAIALEQVLLSLLTNARDALLGQPPGMRRRVRITAARSCDGAALLEVADTGGGIAPEILPRLFEPFATTKSPDRGLGLGLSTSYGLIRSLGGTISASNGPEGAVVTLKLPGVPGQ